MEAEIGGCIYKPREAEDGQQLSKARRETCDRFYLRLFFKSPLQDIFSDFRKSRRKREREISM